VTTDEGKQNNLCHMLVDQYFMNLPVTMIPIGGHRVTEIEDPIGDVPRRLGGVYWAENVRPVAAVVVMGFNTPFPRECDDDWFDNEVSAAMADNASQVMGGYDRVAFLVEDDGDMIVGVMNNGVSGDPWHPTAE